MGTLSFIGAILAVAGLMGSMALTADANKKNSQLQHESMDRQEAMNERNIQAQQEENQKNRDWNEQMALDAFERTAAYNDPKAQKQRLLKAGFNPNLALGSQGAGNTVSQPAASTSASLPAGLPGMLSPSQQPLLGFNDVTGGISQVAQALKSIADARKTGVDTSFLEKSLDDRVNFQNYQTKLAQINSDLLDKYGDIQFDKTLKKLDADINLVLSDNMLRSVEYNESIARIDKLDVEIEKLRVDKRISSAQADYLRAKAVNVHRELDDLHNESVARQRQANASSRLSDASAEGQLIHNSNIDYLDEASIINNDSRTFSNYYNSMKTGNAAIDAVTKNLFWNTALKAIRVHYNKLKLAKMFERYNNRKRK